MRVIMLFSLIFLALPLRADVTVFAAASLRGALDEVNAYYEGKVTVSYASSATLARQISQGAPADIYVSANPEWVRYLQDDPWVDISVTKALLGNELVLIGHSKAEEIALKTLPDHLNGRNLAIGQTDAVPAGIYAGQALEHIGIWAGLAPHVIETDNVRAALALVALGEVDYGIVYRTDAQSSDRVRVLASVSPDTHAPIRYWAALLGEETDAAAYFQHLLSGPATQAFRRHGFLAGEGLNE